MRDHPLKYLLVIVCSGFIVWLWLMISGYAFVMIALGGASASDLPIIYISYFVFYSIFLAVYTFLVRKFVLKNTKKILLFILTIGPLFAPVIYYGSTVVWRWNNDRQSVIAKGNVDVELQKALRYAKPKFLYFNDGHPTISVVVPLSVTQDVNLVANGLVGGPSVHFNEIIKYRFADETTSDNGGLSVPNCGLANQTVQVALKVGYLSPYTDVLKAGDYEARINYQFPRGNEATINHPLNLSMWSGCDKESFNYLIGKKFFITYPAIVNGSRENTENFVVDSIGGK